MPKPRHIIVLDNVAILAVKEVLVVLNFFVAEASK